MKFDYNPLDNIEKEPRQQPIKKTIPISPKTKINLRETNQKDNNRNSIQDRDIFSNHNDQKRFKSLGQEQINQDRIIQRDVSIKNILDNQVQEALPSQPKQDNFTDRKKIRLLEQKADSYLTDRNNQEKQDLFKEQEEVNEFKQQPRKSDEIKQMQQNIKQLLKTECNCKQKIEELQKKIHEQQQSIKQQQKEINQSKKQQEQLDQQKFHHQTQIIQMKNEHEMKLKEMSNLNYTSAQKINQLESINQSQTQTIISQKLQIEQQNQLVENLQKDIDIYLKQIVAQQELKYLNDEMISSNFRQDLKIQDLEQQINKLNQGDLQLYQKIYEKEQLNQEQNNKINQQNLLINKLQCIQQNSERKQQELDQQIQNLRLQLQDQQNVNQPIHQESFRSNKIKFRLIDCDIQKENLQDLLEMNNLKNIQFKYKEKEFIEYQIQNESIIIQGSDYSYQISRNNNESYALKGEGFQQPFITKESAAQQLLPSLISKFLLTNFYGQLYLQRDKQPNLEIPSFQFVMPVILKAENKEQYWIAERQHNGALEQYNSKEGRIFLTDNDVANNFLTAFSFFTNYTTVSNYTILDFVSVGKLLIKPSICTKDYGCPLAFLYNFKAKKIGYKYLDLIGIEFSK